MSWITAIDERILDTAQLVADGVHDFTGIDSIGQLRILCGLQAVGWLTLLIQGNVRGASFDWIAGLLVFGNLTSAFWGGRDMMPRVGTRNKKRIDPFYRGMRVGGLVVVGLMFVVSFVHLAIDSHFDWWVGIFVCSWLSWSWEALDVQKPKPRRVRSLLLQPVTEGSGS